MKSPNNLLWIDFETTGLMDNPHTEPLEVTAIVTDCTGKVLGGTPSILIEVSGEALESMSEYVQQMHQKTGLLRRLAMSVGKSHDEVDEVLHHLISTHFPEKSSEFKGAVLAGNSVHFDMRVIEKFFPQTHSLLSHRVLDMTSVQQFFERSNMRSVAEEIPDFGSDHTSKNDVFASICRYNYFRRSLEGK